MTSATLLRALAAFRTELTGRFAAELLEAVVDHVPETADGGLLRLGVLLALYAAFALLPSLLRRLKRWWPPWRKRT